MELVFAQGGRLRKKTLLTQRRERIIRENHDKGRHDEGYKNNNREGGILNWSLAGRRKTLARKQNKLRSEDLGSIP